MRKILLSSVLTLATLTSTQAVLLYQDTFQSYPTASPAPSPLTGGPDGGLWYFVDPTPPTIGNNEHRIFDSAGAGGAFQSRIWISNTDNARLTNAISIPTLPSGAGPHTFVLRFIAGTDTTLAGRIATFQYGIASSAGTLQFVSGGSADGSTVFSGLTGYAPAPIGATGKSANRQFSVVFTGTGLTTADKIYFDFTRITNSGQAGVFMALDDVSLSVDTGAPMVSTNPVSMNNVAAGSSVTFFASFTNYPFSYQWYKDGEPILGATATNYTIPFLTVDHEGSYVLWATNFERTAAGSTLPATLTVADSVAPTIAGVIPSYSLEHLRVRFSEPVNNTTATDTANYNVSGGATISSVVVIDPFTVELAAGPLGPNSSRTVTISGVQDLAGNTISPGSTANFTTPNLTVSSVLYNAGTLTTHPAGAPDPTSPEGGFWRYMTNANPAFGAGPVSGDYGTEFNAWAMVDPVVATGSGIADYRMRVDAASDEWARTNGWRLLVHARLAEDGSIFGNMTAPVFLYSHPGAPRRFGVQFSFDGSVLTANLINGGAYPLNFLADPRAFHTHVLAYDPATTNAAYYVDGVLVAANYIGDAGVTYDGVTFGMGSSTGIGQMNFNRVQLDVAGGGQPTVVSHPQSITVGVGQEVTFQAEFTPFVGNYQWFTNNVLVPGVEGNSWTIDFVTEAMSGLQVKARALHPLGNVETDTAVLTVTDDTTPPTILGAQGSMLLDRVVVTFSEYVNAEQATDLANYTWETPGITSVSAVMLDPATVELRTTKQEPNTSYTVRVSNVRDTSNLPIVNNSPATFKTPKLVTIAKYDAGTTVTRPAGPPAPNDVEGGSWVVNNGTDPLLTTNAILDDLGTGFHAWQVSDGTTAANQFIQYNFPQTPEESAIRSTNGWVLTVFGRFVDDFANSPVTVMTQYGHQSGRRHLIWFDHDANDELFVQLHGGANGTVTTGTGANYHLHQIVFNPVTTNAAYYLDGELRSQNWVGDVSGFTYAGVQWGTGSALNTGTMNFNLVEFQVVPPPLLPTLTIAPNGASVDVSYTGILEATSSLTAGWTAIGTNATENPVLLTVPTTGAPQRFFRARAVEEP